MTFDLATTRALEEPLDPARVKTREGSGGRRLSYLEGHDVIRTANRIFGFGKWSSEVVELEHILSEPVTRDNRQGFRVGYRAIVRVHAGDAVFADTGYGDATEYTGSAITPHELASKEAVTDALKRCLMHFGDQFGLVLYSKDSPAQNGAQAAHQAQAAQPSSSSLPSSTISEPQRKRLFAIAKSKNVDDDTVKRLVKEVAGVESSSAVPKAKYDALVSAVEMAAVMEGAPAGGTLDEKDVPFAPTMDGTV